MSSLMRNFVMLFLATLPLTACGETSSDWSSREDIVATEANDPEIDAAIETARKTLPQFWDALSDANQGDHSFYIKVGLAADNGGVEHIWADNLTRNGSQITGFLINVPMHLSEYKLGDPVSFTKNEVTDWQFIRDGKSEGNHVTKVLLNRMSPEKAQEVRSILGWDQ